MPDNFKNYEEEIKNCKNKIEIKIEEIKNNRKAIEIYQENIKNYTDEIKNNTKTIEKYVEDMQKETDQKSKEFYMVYSLVVQYNFCALIFTIIYI